MSNRRDFLKAVAAAGGWFAYKGLVPSRLLAAPKKRFPPGSWGGNMPTWCHDLVRDGGKIYPLLVEAIECLRSDTKYTALVSQGHSYLVRVPLSTFEKRLNPSRFLKVNRGCIVNLDFVVAMVPDDSSQLSIQLQDGTRVTASREVSRQLRADSL